MFNFIIIIKNKSTIYINIDYYVDISKKKKKNEQLINKKYYFYTLKKIKYYGQITRSKKGN